MNTVPIPRTLVLFLGLLGLGISPFEKRPLDRREVMPFLEAGRALRSPDEFRQFRTAVERRMEEWWQGPERRRLSDEALARIPAATNGPPPPPAPELILSLDEQIGEWQGELRQMLDREQGVFLARLHENQDLAAISHLRKSLSAYADSEDRRLTDDLETDISSWRGVMEAERQGQVEAAISSQGASWGLYRDSLQMTGDMLAAFDEAMEKRRFIESQALRQASRILVGERQRRYEIKRNLYLKITSNHAPLPPQDLATWEDQVSRQDGQAGDWMAAVDQALSEGRIQGPDLLANMKSGESPDRQAADLVNGIRPSLEQGLAGVLSNMGYALTAPEGAQIDITTLRDDYKIRIGEEINRGLALWAQAESRLADAFSTWQAESAANYDRGMAQWNLAFTQLEQARGEWRTRIDSQLVAANGLWASNIGQLYLGLTNANGSMNEILSAQQENFGGYLQTLGNDVSSVLAMKSQVEQMRVEYRTLLGGLIQPVGKGLLTNVSEVWSNEGLSLSQAELHRLTTDSHFSTFAWASWYQGDLTKAILDRDILTLACGKIGWNAFIPKLKVGEQIHDLEASTWFAGTWYGAPRYPYDYMDYWESIPRDLGGQSSLEVRELNGNLQFRLIVSLQYTQNRIHENTWAGPGTRWQVVDTHHGSVSWTNGWNDACDAWFSNTYGAENLRRANIYLKQLKELDALAASLPALETSAWAKYDAFLRGSATGTGLFTRNGDANDLYYKTDLEFQQDRLSLRLSEATREETRARAALAIARDPGQWSKTRVAEAEAQMVQAEGAYASASTNLQDLQKAADLVYQNQVASVQKKIAETGKQFQAQQSNFKSIQDSYAKGLETLRLPTANVNAFLAVEATYKEAKAALDATNSFYESLQAAQEQGTVAWMAALQSVTTAGIDLDQKDGARSLARTRYDAMAHIDDIPISRFQQAVDDAVSNLSALTAMSLDLEARIKGRVTAPFTTRHADLFDTWYVQATNLNRWEKELATEFPSTGQSTLIPDSVLEKATNGLFWGRLDTWNPISTNRQTLLVDPYWAFVTNSNAVQVPIGHGATRTYWDITITSNQVFHTNVLTLLNYMPGTMIFFNTGWSMPRFGEYVYYYTNLDGLFVRPNLTYSNWVSWLLTSPTGATRQMDLVSELRYYQYPKEFPSYATLSNWKGEISNYWTADYLLMGPDRIATNTYTIDPGMLTTALASFQNSGLPYDRFLWAQSLLGLKPWATAAEYRSALGAHVARLKAQTTSNLDHLFTVANDEATNGTFDPRSTWGDLLPALFDKSRTFAATTEGSPWKTTLDHLGPYLGNLMAEMQSRKAESQGTAWQIQATRILEEQARWNETIGDLVDAGETKWAAAQASLVSARQHWVNQFQEDSHLASLSWAARNDQLNAHKVYWAQAATREVTHGQREAYLGEIRTVGNELIGRLFDNLPRTVAGSSDSELERAALLSHIAALSQTSLDSHLLGRGGSLNIAFTPTQLGTLSFLSGDEIHSQVASLMEETETVANRLRNSQLFEAAEANRAMREAAINDMNERTGDSLSGMMLGANYTRHGSTWTRRVVVDSTAWEDQYAVQSVSAYEAHEKVRIQNPHTLERILSESSDLAEFLLRSVSETVSKVWEDFMGKDGESEDQKYATAKMYRWVGKSPEFKPIPRDLSPDEQKLTDEARLLRYTTRGSGQMDAIMVAFRLNDIASGRGAAAANQPFFSKKLFDDDLDNDGHSETFIAAPSLMSVATIAAGLIPGAGWAISAGLQAVGTMASGAYYGRDAASIALDTVKGLGVAAIGRLTGGLGDKILGPAATTFLGSMASAGISSTASSIGSAVVNAVELRNGQLVFNQSPAYWENAAKNTLQGVALGAVAAGVTYGVNSLVASATHMDFRDGKFNYTDARNQTQSLTGSLASRVGAIGSLAGSLASSLTATFAFKQDFKLNLGGVVDFNLSSALRGDHTGLISVGNSGFRADMVYGAIQGIQAASWVGNQLQTIQSGAMTTAGQYARNAASARLNLVNNFSIAAGGGANAHLLDQILGGQVAVDFASTGSKGDLASDIGNSMARFGKADHDKQRIVLNEAFLYTSSLESTVLGASLIGKEGSMLNDKANQTHTSREVASYRSMGATYEQLASHYGSQLDQSQMGMLNGIVAASRGNDAQMAQTLANMGLDSGVTAQENSRLPLGLPKDWGFANAVAVLSRRRQGEVEREDEFEKVKGEDNGRLFGFSKNLAKKILPDSVYNQIKSVLKPKQGQSPDSLLAGNPPTSHELALAKVFNNVLGEQNRSAASTIGVEPEMLGAIFLKESAVFGLSANSLRFETRPFNELTSNTFSNLFQNGNGPLDQRFRVSTNESFSILHQDNYQRETQAFNLAYSLNSNAATMASSWGIGQVMGFNYKSLGYSSPEEMRVSLQGNWATQINGAASFIKSQPDLLKAFTKTDFKTIAQLYNGGLPGYKEGIQRWYGILKSSR